MTPADLLGVIVRAAGLGLILAGLINIGHILVSMAGLPTSTTEPLSVVIASIAFWVVAGVLVFAAAGPIVRLAYGRGGGSN